VSDRGYQAAIARGLEEALIRATPLDWDAEVDRIIVFSDLHRGQGDHADDFRVCAETYRRAIDFYLGAGYRLVVLGDAEELWEGWPKKVLPTYRGILDTENRFHAAAGERFTKIWGNHDDLWQYPEQVARHLVPIYGELDVVEGLDVTVTTSDTVPGRIFLVHGHQGTGSSDRWGGISRRFVRWVWRPIQRLFKVSLNTPATDFEIRGKHDRAMYEWAAARNDLILIAGHTHNPVFVSRPHLPTLERVHDSLSATPDDGAKAGQLDLEISWARAEAGDDPPDGRTRDRSCYFNSGCCCFSNGDITGIELADGEIRLVRWTAGPFDPEDRVIEVRDLASVFAGLSAS
jgi:UDP-2,3-diacylglucosamine pyrophosphatase LpxH